jgi:hypothetical protein
MVPILTPLFHLKDRLPGKPGNQDIHHGFLDYDQSSLRILDNLKESTTYLTTLQD